MRHPILYASLALTLVPAALHAAAFTPGNLVIYRVGDGTATLVNTGNTVFLDEYTPLGVLVQSVPVPATTQGTNNPLISSGTGASEGTLNLSPDGRFLTFTGYDTTVGGGVSLSTTTSTAVPRTVGIVGADGAVNTTTALTDFASANNPRSAVTLDGSTVYVGGGVGGVRSATVGGTTSISISSTFANIRDVGIYGGQLYASSGASTLRLGTVGSGVPTTTGQTTTNLPGLPTSGNSSYDQFFLADLSAGIAGYDTLYVADEGNGGSNAGGILKYGLVSGTWTLEGTIAGSATDPYHGLTGSVSNGTVTLFATTVGNGTTTGNGKLYTITDASGQAGTLAGTATELADATTNEAFRGVAYAPVPEPSTVGSLLAGLMALGGWRRFRKPARP